MPTVIERQDPQDPGFMPKVSQFISLRSRIDDLSKERDSIKADLSELVDTIGEPDEKETCGSVFPTKLTDSHLYSVSAKCLNL